MRLPGKIPGRDSWHETPGSIFRAWTSRPRVPDETPARGMRYRGWCERLTCLTTSSLQDSRECNPKISLAQVAIAAAHVLLILATPMQTKAHSG
jgi:hypothetical protein